MQEFVHSETGICYRTNHFDGAQKTLLFIHGLSGSASAWVKYEEKFKNSYNIVTLDLRGHGKSKKYGTYDDYRMELFADDIEKLLMSLAISKCIVIAHSFGVLVSLELMKKMVDKISSVVFLSPAGRGRERYC